MPEDARHARNRTRRVACAIITTSGVPADRRDAALVLEARAPATRRAYRVALSRLEEALAGRELTDATLAGHVTAFVAGGLAPASIAQAVAAACFFAGVAPAGRTRADP